MSQELASVISKIRGLANMTTKNGCSEGEALNAARMVGKLLTTYDLTLSKVLLDAERCVDLVIPTGRKKRHPIDFCVVSLAEFAHSKVWISTPWEKDENGDYDKQQVYHFFGMPADVEMVKWLYDLIKSAIDNETEKYKESIEYAKELEVGYHGRRLSIAFQKGMSRRISSRLQDMKNDRNRETSAKPVVYIDPVTHQATSADIVLIKRDKVEDEFNKLGLSMRRAAVASGGGHYGAYNAGIDAGDRVNLNRPVGNGRVAGYLE
jgi:hypothetical protein